MVENKQQLNHLIRVAFIVHTFDMGGVERSVARLSNHLGRESFHPMVICLNRSGTAAQWIERSDVEIVEIHKQPRNDVDAIRRLSRILREKRIDVVHSHNWGTLVETSLARKWANVPVHVHSERGTVLGALDLQAPRRWLRSTAMRWALDRADTVVSNAQATAAKVQRLCGYPANCIQVIPNGVERPRVVDQNYAREKLRSELRIDEAATVIGSVGRLVPVKNFGMAIDAIGELCRQGSNVHLLLVGDGPLHDSLSARAMHLGIADRIHLVGRREDVGRWMAAMDVYVNCSKSEGMSQSVVEAMAVGLPIIATDVGDNGILVGGDDPCGQIVPSADVSALGRAITVLIADPAAARRYRLTAEDRHRQRYVPDKMIREYEDLYSGLRKRPELPGESARKWSASESGNLVSAHDQPACEQARP